MPASVIVLELLVKPMQNYGRLLKMLKIGGKIYMAARFGVHSFGTILE